MSQISELVDLFQRQKRFITRANRMDAHDSNRHIAKATKERFDAMRIHVLEQMLALSMGDVQTVYNYLVELVKSKQCSESTIWAILDDLILAVIPNKPYREEDAA